MLAAEPAIAFKTNKAGAITASSLGNVTFKLPPATIVCTKSTGTGEVPLGAFETFFASFGFTGCSETTNKVAAVITGPEWTFADVKETLSFKTAATITYTVLGAACSIKIPNGVENQERAVVSYANKAATFEAKAAAANIKYATAGGFPCPAGGGAAGEFNGNYEVTLAGVGAKIEA